MIFEKIDFLSPKITLFYKYKKRHSSSIGGFLTIVLFIACLYFTLQFLIRLFLHSSPSVIFYRKYEKDLSKYSFDSAITHLIWISNNNNINDNGTHKTILNTKAIRVILLADENNYEVNPSNLWNYEHWLYDNCEKDDFTYYENMIFNDEYIKGNNNITNAICIRHYYNKTEKKYYSLNKSESNLNNKNNFKYPYLEQGVSNKKNSLLSTIIEKCTNNSITNFIFGDCENEENIQKYLREYNSAYIQILDHQVDLTNYFTPIQSYFMGISSILTHNNSYEVKTINLSPLLVKSNQNLINNVLFEKSTVIVDNIYSSIIGNTNINNNKILLKYLFAIQNYRQIYERKYEDIFGAFSSIGGIIQFFYYIFYLINYFFNDFILILNTQNLFLNDPKSKRFTRLMPFGKYPMRLDSKVGNNILSKNYESNNHIPDLKFFKMLSKDKIDGDMSSIQLSEPNIDKDSKYLFNIIKEENLIEHSARRSQQLNYNNITNFKIKNDIKNKSGYRNSMFNPKNKISFSPFQKTMDNKSNIINIMSSNNEESNNEEKKNSLKIVKFDGKNDLKQITFTGNKDKNNIDNSHSFAENVKMGNYLKSKRKSMYISKNFLPKKKANKQLQKLYEATDRFIYEKLNFKEYLRFKCCYRNRRKDILIVQRFRRKLLSEEHFFKSHLFIYLLIQKIKIDKQDKSDIKELYSEL
jgi:hypothetical protein